MRSAGTRTSPDSTLNSRCSTAPTTATGRRGKQGGDQLGLVREVPVEAALGHARLDHDVVDGDRLDPAREKQRQRGARQRAGALPAVLVALAARRPGALRRNPPG